MMAERWNEAPTATHAGGPAGGVRYRGQHAVAPGLSRRYSTASILSITIVASVLFVVAAAPAEKRARSAGTAPMATVATVGRAPAAAAVIEREAESSHNTLTGSANVIRYPGASGGQLVQAIGAWGSRRGPGALRFDNIPAARTGVYLLTFFFVNIRAKTTRTAVITASGAMSDIVTLAGTSRCCTSQRLLVLLVKGANSITFANPTDEAPAIDRITVSAFTP